MHRAQLSITELEKAVLLGRELFISNGIWDFDPFGQSNWSSASLVRGRNWPQSSNNISYQSPKFAGFDFYGQYSLSNATNWNGNGTTPQGREAGAYITYTTPLFQIRGMYDEIRNPANGTLGGAYNPIDGGSGGNGVYAYSREYTAMFNLFLGQFKVQGAYQAIRSSGMTGQLPGQLARVGGLGDSSSRRPANALGSRKLEWGSSVRSMPGIAP